MTIKINAVNVCIFVLIIVVIAIGIRKRTAKLMQGFVASFGVTRDVATDSTSNCSSNLGGGGGGAGGGGGGLRGGRAAGNYIGSAARGQTSVGRDGSDISVDGAFRKGFSGQERCAESRREYEREIGPEHGKRFNNCGSASDVCSSNTNTSYGGNWLSWLYPTYIYKCESSSDCYSGVCSNGTCV